jgi:hypothetical protein
MKGRICRLNFLSFPMNRFFKPVKFACTPGMQKKIYLNKENVRLLEGVSG